MNCTTLETNAEDVIDFLGGDVGFAILCTAGALLSLVLLLFGERLVRPVCAVAGAVSGGAVVYVMTGLLESVSCAARLAIAGVGAIMTALLALCMLKSGIFIVGAAGFGTVAHFVYRALPLSTVTPPFYVLSLSAYYYLAIAVGAAIGAAVACVQRVALMRVCSSVLGGAGVACVVWLACGRAGYDPPELLLLVIVLVCCLGGVYAQKRLAQRGESRMGEGRGRRDTHAEGGE